MKKISTKVHGILDYGTAAAMLIVPRVLRWDSSIVKVMTGSAILSTITALMTKYELGVFKVLPMKGHLAMDAAQATAWAASPLMLADGRKSITAGLLGLAAYEALVILNSQTRPKRKFLWFKF